MTAFVSFVRVYAVWIYLLCALGVLVGAKTLSDARRLSRTTLFSLEQERATEQLYRSLLLIAIMFVAVGVVTAVNFFGPLLVPTQQPAILGGATATILPYVFPSNTPTPTVTWTPPPPTATPIVTATAFITPTATRPPKLTATPSAGGAPTPFLPAPVLSGPDDGSVFNNLGAANVAITFKWSWDCPQCKLGPDDKFVVVILFVDSSGKPRIVGGGTRDDLLAMADILRGGEEVWHQGQGDAYQWYVQVKRSPNDLPLSAPSETRKFVWH
ncbi:MAG: hypothetical protein M1482_04670 [Chloroflexi bacterium]|nr:hypothetical protein [Chloroflexota bacterium]